MSIKAITFDLDGTLLNTLDDIAFAANHVLENMGFPPHPVDSYKYMVGNGVFVLFQKALPQDQVNDPLLKSCADAFSDIYKKNDSQLVRIYDGIEELLTGLSDRNIRMTVLSNKPHELTRITISKIFSQWEFEIVLGQRQGVPPKPDPQGAIEIANSLSLKCSEILYLGDTAVDMKTATNAGMIPVGALWGFRDRTELEENGASFLIEHPREVFNIIDK